MNVDREHVWDAVADTVEFTVQIDVDRFAALVPREARVLDFGCGYGRHSALLQSRGYANVRGCDPSLAMIERGRREHPSVSFLHLPELPMPESAASYDAVFCCAVLTAIPQPSDRHPVLAEVNRLLAAGGVFYSVEFLTQPDRQYAADGTLHSGLGPTMKHFKIDELLEEVGASLALADTWERRDVDLRQRSVSVVHSMWRRP